MPDYDSSVFINCPFDDDFAPLLEAMVFCIVRAGLEPRLASERLEGGESRLEKILELIETCRFSIHDLSRSISSAAGEAQRMNMPFELGLDMGRRRAPDVQTNNKKFLIFEKNKFDLKRALSDLAGTDAAYHENDFQLVMRKVRNFLTVEASRTMPGATLLAGEYYDFLGWMTELKIYEGNTEDEAKNLPTSERLGALKLWMDLGRPSVFTPS